MSDIEPVDWGPVEEWQDEVLQIRLDWAKEKHQELRQQASQLFDQIMDYEREQFRRLMRDDA